MGLVFGLFVGGGFLSPAMVVIVRSRIFVLGLMFVLGRLRSAACARDVGYRSEVVPVEAMPQSEHEGSDQEGDYAAVNFGHPDIVACCCNCVWLHYRCYLHHREPGTSHFPTI